MNKFNESSFSADKRGTSNSWTPNMKTEMQLRCCILVLTFLYYKDQNWPKLLNKNFTIYT